MPHRLRPAAFIVASLLLVGTAAGAQTIEVPSFGASYGCVNQVNVVPAFFCGQSFTAPAGSNVLQSFSFTISTQHVLAFELYAFSAPNVMGPTLFSQALGPTSGFESLTFTPVDGVPLTGGAMYVALVRMDPDQRVDFLANSQNPYTGGGRISCDANPTLGECNSQSGTHDLAFTAVFSPAVTPVPEPATRALTGAGLLLLGGLARRRRA
jgi:hypothetical protein